MINTPIARRGRPVELVLLVLFCLFVLAVRGRTATGALTDDAWREDARAVAAAIVEHHPRTFSAAQMLVNELERYTRVSFVGEPTGSRPATFGDPLRQTLPNSGLMLRVSRLYWSSYTAFDEREASEPDFRVDWTSDDYFSGRDPALEFAATAGEISLEDLVGEALMQTDLHKIGRCTLDSRRAPDTWHRDFSAMLLALGNEFRDTGDTEAATLAYSVGRFFYPEKARMAEALAALEPD